MTSTVRYTCNTSRHGTARLAGWPTHRHAAAAVGGEGPERGGVGEGGGGLLWLERLEEALRHRGLAQNGCAHHMLRKDGGDSDYIKRGAGPRWQQSSHAVEGQGVTVIIKRGAGPR